MKRTGITLFLVLAGSPLFFITSCSNREASSENARTRSVSPGDTANIFFSEYEHTFSKVTDGEKVVSVFTFENRGNIPLVIASATTSCGCTVSNYSTKPVAPGKTGTVEVIFDSSGRSGKQSKTITIRSNATRPVVFLRITGEVVSVNNN